MRGFETLLFIMRGIGAGVCAWIATILLHWLIWDVLGPRLVRLLRP